jgi:predicted GNAT family N-acyltransferase
MFQQGVLQMHGTKPPSSPKPDRRAISIRIARDPNDLMLVTAIRAAVYLAEQDCPIEEEFDGNDLVAAHFIGFIGTEPAACLRVRFFGEFAKLERLAVRHQFRRSRISFKLVQASFDYIKRKGFKKVYGHAQDRLVNFWAHFGAKPLGHNRKITFSDFSYTEMVLDLEPCPNAITLDSDPYVMIRPEGDWDRPGVLDISSGRSATSPLRTPALVET